MNFYSNIDHLFVYLIYFSTLAIYVESGFTPLNFNPDNSALIDLNRRIGDRDWTIREKLATACPAQTPYETHINSIYSFGKNSLFVRHIYDESTPPSTVLQDICANAYKLSISYHKSTRHVVLGYEVYFFRAIHAIDNDNNYNNYNSVANAFSRRTQFIPNQELPDGIGFMWIGIITIKFESRMMTPTKVIYILSDTTEIGASCKDYSLGQEIYGQSIRLDLLYKNQDEIFSDIVIPRGDHGCAQQNNCLIKYSLAPAEEFRFRSPEPMLTSCSNLATVPIWTSAINGALQKLDQFLYALIYYAREKLTVVSGTQGKLEMKDIFGRIAKISLGDGNKVPVPNIIYKMVQYEYKIEVGDSETETILEAVVIIFHNDPEFNENDALCQGYQNNCNSWGFGEILRQATSSSRGFSSKNVYCCPGTRELVEKLGMEYQRQDSNVLDLKQFYTDRCTYNKQTKTKQTENIEQSVKNKMLTLFGQ